MNAYVIYRIANGKTLDYICFSSTDTIARKILAARRVQFPDNEMRLASNGRWVDA